MITLCESMEDPDVIVESRYPVPMEQMGQNNGYLMYRVAVTGPATINMPIFGDRYGIKMPIFGDRYNGIKMPIFGDTVKRGYS